MLKTEFNVLYRSLFNNASLHEAIVRQLAKKPSGMSRVEVIKACGLTTGGTTTKLFGELEQSGFISYYIAFEKTLRDGVYKLSDEYSLFYLKFIDRARATGAGTWQKISESQSYNSWSGYAFEAICHKHLPQIKNALGIGAVYTEASSWRYNPQKDDNGAQIDLLLDRQDHCINICEIKFYSAAFIIDKKYAKELDNKVAVFKEKTETKKTIFPTMITIYGTKQNIYYT